MDRRRPPGPAPRRRRLASGQDHTGPCAGTPATPRARRWVSGPPRQPAQIPGPLMISTGPVPRAARPLTAFTAASTARPHGHRQPLGSTPPRGASISVAPSGFGTLDPTVASSSALQLRDPISPRFAPAKDRWWASSGVPLVRTASLSAPAPDVVRIAACPDGRPVTVPGAAALIAARELALLHPAFDQAATRRSGPRSAGPGGTRRVDPLKPFIQTVDAVNGVLVRFAPAVAPNRGAVLRGGDRWSSAAAGNGRHLNRLHGHSGRWVGWFPAVTSRFRSPFSTGVAPTANLRGLNPDFSRNRPQLTLHCLLDHRCASPACGAHLARDPVRNTGAPT